MDIDDVHSFRSDDVFQVQRFSQDHIMWSPFHLDNPAPPFFDKLSTEIVQLILRDVCPVIAIPASRRHLEKYKRAVNIAEVVKIALVCKRWHDILLEDQSMWATMVINATKFEDDEDQDDAESSIRDASINLLHRCLALSGTRALDLTIYGKSASFEGNSEVLDQLIPYSERWKSIAFDMPMEGELLSKLEAFRNRIPSLRYLRLQLSTGFDTELRCTVFENAPLLTEIHLAYVHASELLGPSLKFPWSQISRATFEGCLFPEAIDLDRVFRILARSPLEALTFTLVSLLDETSIPIGGPTNIWSAANVVTMANLRELEITPEDSNSCDVLDRFNCPSLTHLNVQLGRHETESISVIQFLRRSSCELKFISLRGLPGISQKYDHITSILRHAPLATVISLDLTIDEKATEAVADTLMFDQSARFPSLHSLSITIDEVDSGPLSCEGLWLQIQLVKKVIESRTRRSDISDHFDPASLGCIPDVFLEEFVFIITPVEDDSIWDEEYLGDLESFCAARNVALRISLLDLAAVEESESGSESSDSEDYETDPGDSEDHETDASDAEDHEIDPDPVSELESH